MVKNLPAMQETRVQSLGWEDPLEKEMATHSRVFLPGQFHRQRSQVGYSPWGCKELDTTELPTFSFKGAYRNKKELQNMPISTRSYHQQCHPLKKLCFIILRERLLLN